VSARVYWWGIASAWVPVLKWAAALRSVAVSVLKSAAVSGLELARGCRWQLAFLLRRRVWRSMCRVGRLLAARVLIHFL
jgi:hypothetical protein